MSEKSFKEAVREAQLKKENEQRKKELEKNLNICEQNRKQAIEKGKKARLENDKAGEALASKEYQLATNMKKKYQQISSKISEVKYHEEMLKLQSYYYDELARLNSIISGKGSKDLMKKGKKAFGQQKKMEKVKNQIEIMSDLTFGDDTLDEVSDEFQNIVDKELAKDQENIDIIEEVLGSNKESDEN